MANFLINNAQTLTTTISLNDLLNATARQGDYLDFGENREKLWTATLQVAPSGAPTAGTTCEVYVGFGETTGTYAGGASGIDSAYTGPDGTVANGKNQLTFIGTFVACASTGVQIMDVGTFIPIKRYGTPIVYNALGVALSSVAANQILKFTSIKDKTG